MSRGVTGMLRRDDGVMSAGRLRGIALLPLGALAVHQGRYYAAFGGHADLKLAEQGHAYLGSVALVASLLVAAVAGDVAVRLARAWRAGAHAADSPDFGTLKAWATVTCALVAIFIGQELLEGLLTTGHPGGIAGVLGAGGWFAVPIAAAVGGLIALALRGAQLAIALLAAVGARRRRRQSSRSERPVACGSRRRRAPLADRLAGRAPPASASLLT